MRVGRIVSLLVAAMTTFMSGTSFAREAPKNIALSTGSTLATWTIPGIAAPSVKSHLTPVIFLHGGPGMYTEDRRLDMGQAFRAAGFTTIYYDQIGGGQSARIPATNYNLARMIADLEALRVSLGAEKMVLWGNSWGSQLAILYAQAYPTRVAGFVLTSPGGFPGENFRRDYSPTKRTNVTIGRDLSSAIRQIDRKGGAAEPAVSQINSGLLMDQLVSAEMLEGMVCKTSDIAQAPLPGGSNLFVNRIVANEVERARPNWTSVPRVPTAILRGACDFIPVASANRYAAITGGTVLTLANVGHGLIEDPTSLNAALTVFIREGLANLP